MGEPETRPTGVRENGHITKSVEGRLSAQQGQPTGNLSGIANGDSGGPSADRANRVSLRGFPGQRQGSGTVPATALGRVEFLASRSGRLDADEAYSIQANADPEPQPRSRPQETAVAPETAKKLAAAVSKPDGGFQWPPQASSHNIPPPAAPHSNGNIPHLQPARNAESKPQILEAHPPRTDSATQQAVSSLESKSALGNPGLHMPMGMGRKGPASVAVEAKLDTPCRALDAPFEVAPIGAAAATATYDPKALGVNTCPFRHGTVDAAPYPGMCARSYKSVYDCRCYVHGRHPEMCPLKCKPVLGATKGETKKQTLIREALEYQELFHHEKGHPPEEKAARVAEVLASIETTGTYVHTFDELQHGARVAWRNAPKCGNRKFAMELKLLDKRGVTTPEQMHTACLDMLELASTSGATETFLTAFKPQHPLTGDGGPRVWNSQLLRYAGYRQDDMSVLGDPSELQFTELCQRKFGWRPPGNKQGRFTILPLVLQADPQSAPQMYEIPSSYPVEIPLIHPTHHWFAELGLKWYAIPAVSNMELSLGGLLYTGIPFSGWYADSEIVRNMTDESRYNQLPVIAQRLGMSISDNRNLWRDAALVVLNQAVLFSFQSCSVAMVDHHTLMQQFWIWHAEELKTRGYSPGNWKWIIPPVAAHTSKCYLGLNKMTEYTLKPALFYAPGFKSYAKAWFGPTFARHEPSIKPIQLNPFFAKWVGRIKMRTSVQRPRCLVLYATVSGNSKQFSSRAVRIMRKQWQMKLFNLEDFNSQTMIQWPQFDIIMLITSTYGSGAAPGSANRFLKWLLHQSTLPEGESKLQGKTFSVLGLGSSCYPRFCAAADLFNSMLLAAGAKPITRVHRCDAVGHSSESSFMGWLVDVTTAMKDLGRNEAACEQLLVHLKSGNAESTEFQVIAQTINMPGVRRMARDPQWMSGKVVEAIDLLPATAAKENRVVKLIKVDISGNHVSYEPGDHIAVLPNQVHMMEDIAILAENLGLAATAASARTDQANLDTPFDLEILEGLAPTALEGMDFGGKRFALPNTYRKVLSEFCALQDYVGRDSLAIMSQYAGEAADKTEMEGLGRDPVLFEAWSNHTRLRWIDLFKSFPSLGKKLPIEVFLQLVPLMHARYYSIASSSAVEQNQVHMLVGRVAWKAADGSQRFGQASSFLTTHAPPGTPISFKLIRVVSFRLPMNVRSPVVMLAAGTGLAPLRSFIQHRMQLRAKGVIGPCVLVYGCRSLPDFICKQEIDEALRVGAITEVMTAFSRSIPKTKKEYVQTKVSDRGKWMRNMLRAPDAHVYICGDSLMANAVTASLTQVMGEDKISLMTAQGRFHEDVFGATQQSQIEDAMASASGRSANQALLTAAQASSVQGVREALTKGARVDAADDQGNNLLHIAASNNSVELAKMLLAQSEEVPPVNSINHWLQTPAAVAHTKGSKEVAEVLVKAGGKLACGMHESFYPLHLAALKGNVGEQDVPPANSWGHTPLMCALTFQQAKTVKVLKAGGARMTASGTNFTSNWPSSVTWNPASANNKQALAAKMTPDRVAQCQAMWSFVSGKMNSQGAEEKMRQAGVLLFHNLFELEPRLRQLFPFKTGAGHIDDKVNHILTGQASFLPYNAHCKTPHIGAMWHSQHPACC
ncbi:hypothetical protein WJX74_009932 [Apatococcus lobatus]|uniref:nitric-oxide synthase (NADPH) n=1 Tax=Apatococcus lobatus TaxID=904363 RepID=A0AAW1QTK7_9CHLO